MPALTNILIYGECAATLLTGLCASLAPSSRATTTSSSRTSDVRVGPELDLGAWPNRIRLTCRKFWARCSNSRASSTIPSTQATTALTSTSTTSLWRLWCTPRATPAVLAHHGFTQSFFERWSKLIPHLKRVYDIKLSAMGR